jgi:heme-degrading monooxygenase HmoA
VISVAQSDSEKLIQAATSLMNHKADLQGFIEGEIFRSDDGSRVLIVTEWASQHDWSMSQWDEAVSNNLVSIVQTASAVDARTYYRAGRISKSAD